MSQRDHDAGQPLARMISALEDLLDRRISRTDVLDMTRELWPEGSGQGNPFLRNGDASAVFESIRNIDERRGGEWIVRDCDVREYVRWLNEPTTYEGMREVACVTKSAEEVARALGAAGTRFWFDGLGWYLSFERWSPRSERRFVVLGGLEFETGRRVATIRATHADRADLVDDILVTFGLEERDIVLSEDFDPGRSSTSG